MRNAGCGMRDAGCGKKDCAFVSDQVVSAVSRFRQRVGKFGIPSVLGTEDRRFDSGHADFANWEIDCRKSE